MIESPDAMSPPFVEAGADSVSVHYEACRNLDGTLGLIRKAGALAGVVLNPRPRSRCSKTFWRWRITCS